MNMNRREFAKMAGAAAALAPGAFKAGTAKVDVTPDKPRWCAGGGRPERTYRPIHARCLTLHDGRKRMAIVTYDFNCLDVATPILRERAQKELGIDPASLVLLATHNHQSPLQIAPENFDYGRWLADRIFALIREAISREDGPVDLFFGFGQGYFVRAVGSAHVDYEVQVLKVMRGDRPVALLFNHPSSVLRGPTDFYGPGHPGYAMDEVEAKLPGVLALYADACGGNQFWTPVKGVSDPLEACKHRGHELAEAALKIAGGALEHVTGPLESKLELIDLPLAEPISYSEALKLARRVPLDIGYATVPDKNRGTNWIRALIKHYKEGIPFPTRSSDYPCTDDGIMLPRLPTPRKYECRFVEVLAANIGPLKFIAIQGEPCAPIGARIKDVLRQQGPVMIFGYFAEHNLYIPTRELVRQDAYQARVLRYQYGCPVGWHPDVEDEMVKRTLALYGAEIWSG